MVKLDRASVAKRLAEIGELRAPSRPETEELLVAALLNALRKIPSSGAAWSWGEFHNGGLQPLYDLGTEQDRPRAALLAVDLGLGDDPPDGRTEPVSPRAALSRELTAAIERMLHEVRVLLEGAGFSPYGWSGHPRGP